MKLGFFDSGLGGLLIARSVRDLIPQYDTIYFGDTLHLPYGNRSFDALYAYSCRAMDFLFDEMDCKLIVTACNTVSAGVLRRLQQDYLIKKYPDRRILGVVVPTLETAIDRGFKNIGVIATNFTISSDVYPEELKKINPDIQIHQMNTPLLVPLIENGGMKWIDSVIADYLQPMKDAKIECLILGCTHYSFIKNQISQFFDGSVEVISQDEIIPHKLVDYLRRHSEIDQVLDKNNQAEYFVSDLTPDYMRAAREIYGGNIDVEAVRLCAQSDQFYLKR